MISNSARSGRSISSVSGIPLSAFIDLVIKYLLKYTYSSKGLSS